MINGEIVRGIRRCALCGFTPKTERRPLPADAKIIDVNGVKIRKNTH